MEDPRPGPPPAPGAWPSPCPFAAISPGGRQHEHPHPHQPPLPSLYPQRSPSGQTPNLYGAAHMASSSNQFPQQYEFRNSFQDSFGAERPVRPSRHTITRPQGRTRATPTVVRPGDYDDVPTPTWMMPSPHQAGLNPALHRHPFFPTGLNTRSRPVREVPGGPPFMPGSSLMPQSGLHAGTLANNNNNNNQNHNHHRHQPHPRGLPSPLDPHLTHVPGSTTVNRLPAAPTPRRQPAHRRLPSFGQLGPMHHVHVASPTSRYPDTLPPTNPYFRPLPPGLMPHERSDIPGPGPTTTRPHRRGEGAGAGAAYDPSSYVAILNHPNPRQQLEASVGQPPDPSRPSGLARGTPNAADLTTTNAPRMAALYEYLASGRFEQNVSSSHENNNLTEPGRPLRDFDDYLAEAIIRRGRVEEQDRRNFGPLSGYIDPAHNADRLPDDWHTMMTRDLQEREAELAILLDSNGLPHVPTHGPWHRWRTARHVVEDLKKVEIMSLDPDDRTCGICLEPYGEPEPTRGNIEDAVKVPCGHVFGDICIKKWLSEHSTCPSCRHKFPSEHYVTPRLLGPNDTRTDHAWATSFRRRQVSDLARMGAARTRPSGSSGEPGLTPRMSDMFWPQMDVPPREQYPFWGRSPGEHELARRTENGERRLTTGLTTTTSTTTAWRAPYRASPERAGARGRANPDPLTHPLSNTDLDEIMRERAEARGRANPDPLAHPLSNTDLDELMRELVPGIDLPSPTSPTSGPVRSVTPAPFAGRRREPIPAPVTESASEATTTERRTSLLGPGRRHSLARRVQTSFATDPPTRLTMTSQSEQSFNSLDVEMGPEGGSDESSEEDETF